MYVTTNTTGQFHATQTNADGTKQHWSWSGGHSVANSEWKLADLFGDGRDVFHTVTSSGVHKATRLNKDGTVQNFTWNGGHSPVGGVSELVDLFGEGRNIFYTHNSSGTHYATQLNSDGTKQNWTWTGAFAPENAGWRLADPFGEGRRVFLTIFSKPTDVISNNYNNGSGRISFRISRLNKDGSVDNYESQRNIDDNVLYDGQWEMVDLFGIGRDSFFMARYDLSGDSPPTNATAARHLRINPHPVTPNALSFSSYTVGVDLPVGPEGVQFADIFGVGRKFYYTYKGNGEHFAISFQPSPYQLYNWTDAENTHGQGMQMGDIFGDGREAFVAPDSSGNIYSLRFSNQKPDLINKVISGLDAETAITYKSLTDLTPGFYTKGTGATYPDRDLQLPLYMVSSTSSDNGIGGQNTRDFSYEAAKANVYGRGFLGFGKITSVDNTSGITRHQEYLQSWPFIGAMSASSSWHNGNQLSQVSQTFAQASPTTNSRFVYMDQRTESSWDLNQAALPTVNVQNTYDCTATPTNCYGNLTQKVTSASDGISQTLDQTFANNSTDWLIGQVTRSELTADGVTRTKAYEYHANTGLLTKETVEPDNNQLRLDTVYQHDVFGNMSQETVSSLQPVIRLLPVVVSNTVMIPVAVFRLR